MLKLNFPDYPFRLAIDAGKQMIFDRIRKRFVALTPEEWVRQHLLWFLMDNKSVPENMIAVEKQISINGRPKRFDIVVFARTSAAILLVECKAPSVKITETTFDQAARYNLNLHAGYFVLSNGLSTYCCTINYNTRSYSFLPEVPDYHELNLLAGQ
jgi:type I site-specific restriction-modification system R (restriction) subunit